MRASFPHSILVTTRAYINRSKTYDQPENRAGFFPHQAGPLEDCVSPRTQGFKHASAPALKRQYSHSNHDDEGVLDAESHASYFQAFGPHVADCYSCHGRLSPLLSEARWASPCLSFSPDAPFSSSIQPMRGLSIQGASKAHQNSEPHTSVQVDEDYISSTIVGPLHAIDFRSCKSLEALAPVFFRCLQIGRAVQIISVPFSDLCKWIDRLKEAGFWSIHVKFFTIGTEVEAFACFSVSAVRTVAPTSTVLETQEQFIRLAIRVLNEDPNRLSDLRRLASIDLDLRVWLEAEVFRMIRKNVEVAAEAMFRRYLRYIATAMDDGKPQAPTNLLWLLNEEDKPPESCLDVLDNIAFCRLLLECAGGPKNDLDIGCYTQDDVAGVIELCRHIRRESETHFDAFSLRRT